MLGTRAIGKVRQPCGELHRAHQRVLRESLIQLRELLELRKLGAEGALARLPHREKFLRQHPFLSLGGRALRRRENPPFERHAGLILRVEDRIARDEERVLSTPESPALCARGAFEYVKRFVRRESDQRGDALDRKSTRLNSSHGYISYAVFCLKKKKNINFAGKQRTKQQILSLV